MKEEQKINSLFIASAAGVLRRSRSGRARILVSVLIAALALALPPGQAQLAAEEANKLLDAGMWRLKEVLKPSSSKPQFTVQSVDPPSQSSLVHHFKLCPRKLLLYPGESFTLVPLALDRNKEVVEGAAFEWQSKNSNIADVSSTGEVMAVSPGHTQVEVSAGSAKGKVNVEVRSGSRPKTADRKQGDDDWEVEHGHDCDAPEDDPVAQVRDQKSEVGGQGLWAGDQRSEIRGQRSEASGPALKPAPGASSETGPFLTHASFASTMRGGVKSTTKPAMLRVSPAQAARLQHGPLQSLSNPWHRTAAGEPVGFSMVPILMSRQLPPPRPSTQSASLASPRWRIQWGAR
jgi:hypothetical protein